MAVPIDVATGPGGPEPALAVPGQATGGRSPGRTWGQRLGLMREGRPGRGAQPKQAPAADQGLDFTTQGLELYGVVNTPLLTFKRGVQGVGGTQILPALAKALPTVSNGGKTYTFPLRSGLHYSDGTPIKASDVPYALERDIKIPWQAASFVSAYIQGGTEYDTGKAKTISGITADDATGKITVNLVAP